MKITDLDAHALSAAIHARQLSCRELMQAYLQRMQARPAYQRGIAKGGPVVMSA